jgi:hypothetical protein
VRLVGNTGTTATSEIALFTTKPAPPSILQTAANPISLTSAKLTGLVNPNNAATTYHFDWGTDTTYGNQAPDFDAFTGSEGVPVAVGANISGLQPHTTYHFRLVATNPSGTTEGPDQVLTTLNEAGLPDGRSYELVSPADKRPAGSVKVFNPFQLVFQGSDDGQSMLFDLLNGQSDSTAGGDVMYLASRSATGWQSSQASPPSLISSPERTAPSRLAYFSPSLSCGIVQTPSPVTADTPVADTELGVVNLYRRAQDGTFTLVSNTVPTNPNLGADIEFGSTGNFYRVAGASPDCDRIYFRTEYKLTPGASELYEWNNGVLHDAGLLPNGSPASGIVGPGGESSPNTEEGNASRVRSVSAPGDHFFFSAISNEGGDVGKKAVFVRAGSSSATGTGDLGTGSTTVSNLATATGVFAVGQTITGAGIPAGTVATAVTPTSITLSKLATSTGSGVSLTATMVVDASQKQGGASNDEGARYETASPDGKHVLFAARHGLTPSSRAGQAVECDKSAIGGNAPCDLYDYNVETGALADLSSDEGNPADTIGAAVEGVVDVSDDGSYVYFAALGQLVPNRGKTYAQNVSGTGSSNVYLAHGGMLTYVANIKKSDLAAGNNIRPGRTAWGALIRSEIKWTAHATPDGKNLLFVSTANITGYDSGGGPEAYVYSAATESVRCVSCRLDGQPSLASLETINPRGPIVGTLGRTVFQLDYPRSISDDGRRVFFTSPDVLSPGAVSGNSNVYEWESGQIHLLTKNGFFFDSSQGGDDVFVSSPDQLNENDADTAWDMYDLRVNGGFPAPPPSPAPCDPSAGGCQQPPSSPPGATTPGSVGFMGPGNEATPPPKKPHKPKRHKKPHHHNRSSHNFRGGAR